MNKNLCPLCLRSTENYLDEELVVLREGIGHMSCWMNSLYEPQEARDDKDGNPWWEELEGRLALKCKRTSES